MRGVATTLMGVLGVLIYADVAALLIPFGLVPLGFLLPLRVTDMHEDEGWKVGSYPAEQARISSSHVPDFARTMTVEEAKALMTYPPDFQFVGGKKSAFRQIGNAVPPLLASHILSHLWRD